jgi:hypothetical protein
MASANSSAVRPAATASSSANSSGVAASAASVKAGKDGKMTIKFSLADTPGALQQALGYFARHGVNMTRLESRPARRTSDYVSTTPHFTHALDEQRGGGMQLSALGRDMEVADRRAAAHCCRAVTGFLH